MIFPIASFFYFASLLSDNFYDEFSIFFLKTLQIVYWKVIKDFVGIRVEKGLKVCVLASRLSKILQFFTVTRDPSLGN